MVKMQVFYEGELHTRILHDPSHQEIHTDAPKDNMGKGETFSPTDLVGAALASCIATVLGILARKKGWELSGMRLEIEKTMSTQGQRRIVALPLQIWMPLNLSEEERLLVEKVAKGCPVHHSLHPDIEVKMTIHWPS